MKNTNKLDILIIVLIGFLAFGLQIPWLGFFQDDWNFLFFSSTRGIQGLWEFLIQDGRPGATWVYALGFSLFGYKPAFWQLFSIVIRISTAVVFWLILNRYSLNRRYGNLVATILFLIYPFFTLQPLSVAYAPHFCAFLLFMLSIYYMIHAAERRERYLVYTIPAILFTFTHLFTVEYFIGLELLRPVAMWFSTGMSGESHPGKRAGKMIVQWLPYLLLLIAFVIWRNLFIANLGIRTNPITTIFGADSFVADVARNVFADIVLMLVSTWSKLIDPDLFVVGPVRNLFIFSIVSFSGLVYYFLLKGVAEKDSSPTDLKPVFLTGSLIIITGLAAVYSVGFIIHLKIAPWNSRFSLPTLPGLALVVLGTIEALITIPKTRHVFLSVLVGLLIGLHTQNTFDFKTAWEKQERFYQQLLWRAPSIEPGTAIVANEEILGYMGDYPSSFAINTIYETEPGPEAPFWFFAISAHFDFDIDNFFDKEEIYNRRGIIVFRGNTRKAIFVTYEPENGQCLWVLRPQQASHKYLPENMKVAAQGANNTNIHENTGNLTIYDQIVDEDKSTWCFYYQKAELARQLGDWETIMELWEEANANGLRPYNGFEFLPFIEASGHLERWEEAYKLTDRANKITNGMYFLFCPTWKQLAAETPDSDSKNEYVETANKKLKCTEP